jgi:hypothetical protein
VVSCNSQLAVDQHFAAHPLFPASDSLITVDGILSQQLRSAVLWRAATVDGFTEHPWLQVRDAKVADRSDARCLEESCLKSLTLHHLAANQRSNKRCHLPPTAPEIKFDQVGRWILAATKEGVTQESLDDWPLFKRCQQRPWFVVFIMNHDACFLFFSVG